jgi:cleavage and polyadenylation specificity factor subunit 1
LAAMATAQKADDEIAQLGTTTSLQLAHIPLAETEDTILCDVSLGNPRPIVPLPLRRTVFNTLHGLSHPGIRGTVKLITKRFVWPKINQDVRRWAQSCIACQRAKISKHTKTPLGTFPTPEARFQHVHVDLVGPLPPSRGFIYLLTCIDRFSRWAEAIPISDCSSESTARAFLERWVAQFGCPVSVTTDRGAHFEASFDELLRALGCRHIRTTAYHPEGNGLVERFHRQLKAALKAHANPAWQETLPLVLLGIRSAVKEDLKATPAELVYGSTIRLPGELVSPQALTAFDYGRYAQRLASYMRQVPPAETRTQSIPVQVSKHLADCTYVLVRVDAVKRPLQAPYDGPFKVIERSPKYFVLDKNGRRESIAIDRLKPAFIDKDDSSSPVTSQHASTSSKIVTARPDNASEPAGTSNDTLPPLPQQPISRRGRGLRRPVRFSDYDEVHFI